ncbi:hypothetical protein ACQ4PT_026080 [Festuca glaucescens]
MFRRRFRMRRPLFERIVSALTDWSVEFTDRVDATNREGLSPLQKCTAAIRMLAYGTSADQLDEVLMMGASTALKCLGLFAKGLIVKFGEEYLRPPTVNELQSLLQVGESRGFPGMIGSIDCMHWQWENCPVAWRGQFTRGDHGVPTMILEAVASHDLRIWHAYFGVAGSNNDINVLNQSPLFISTLKGEAPRVQFNVNGRQYNTSYYLADGIYPEWATFVKTIPLPQSEKDKLFAKLQEGARKDVERAFGALQARFNIIRRPARLWKQKSIGEIMTACVILHNMIIEDERGMIHAPLDLNENPGTSLALPPEVIVGPHVAFTDYMRRSSTIRDRPTHVQLKKDLVDNIWERNQPIPQAGHRASGSPRSQISLAEMGSCPSVKNILVLDLEGKRVAVKYYSDEWPSASSKLAFEKSVFVKTQKTGAKAEEADVVMFDGYIVVYKFIEDLHFFVTGGEEENELILASVLQGFSDAVGILLRNKVDKRTALENLDLIFLCIDEVVDGGIVLETDANVIAEKVSGHGLEGAGSYAEQSVTQAFATAKQHFMRSLLN